MFIYRRIWKYIPKNVDHCAMACVLVFCTFYPATYLFIPNDYVTKSDVPSDIFICNISEAESRILCPVISRNLKSYSRVVRTVNKSMMNSMARDLGIAPGGRGSPTHCNGRQKVAIIIPYRNREEQLSLFLQHMHPLLKKQLVSYQLFIIEQSKYMNFNRALLFNIGFKEALTFSDFCCFIFHDVDLLPLSEQHIYSCSWHPRHMCAALDKFRFRLPYPELFGGAIAIRRQTYEQINGYSNKYFGWGGEDDDFYGRLKKLNIPITRWEPNISRYTMLVHKEEMPNPERFNLLYDGTKNFKNDGLNSLKYSVLRSELKPLYTWILVNVTS